MAKPTLLPTRPACTYSSLTPAKRRLLRGGDDFGRGRMSSLSWAFSADSLALYQGSRRSSLDGLCSAPGTACPPLLLPQPGVCAADLYRALAQRRGPLRPAYHAAHRYLHPDRLCSRRRSGKTPGGRHGTLASPDTFLRLIRAQPEEPVPTPRVLGVDDFSFCKRKTYGTILIDLERRVPIDILPDREAATLEKWLKAHAGVEIISRDRGGPYAEGARKGAPDAQQVADRFHLLVEPFRSPETLLPPNRRSSKPWCKSLLRTSLRRRRNNWPPGRPA